MSDTRRDIEIQKWLEYKAAIKETQRDYCYKDCDGHTLDCPYYDAEEETWDFRECFRDRGGF